MTDDVERALLYFADLRLQVCGSPDAVAIVDRCLQLVMAARTADAARLAALEREVEALRAELLRRYGAP